MPHSEHHAVPGLQEFSRLANARQPRIHWCTAESLQVAERAPVGQASSLNLGEGRSYLVIVLLSERCGQVLPEPVEMLAGDPADLLGEKPAGLRVEGLRPGDPAASLPNVQDRIDDLAEHPVEGRGWIIARGPAHADTDAGRRPRHAQGRTTGLRLSTPRDLLISDRASSARSARTSAW